MAIGPANTATGRVVMEIGAAAMVAGLANMATGRVATVIGAAAMATGRVVTVIGPVAMAIGRAVCPGVGPSLLRLISSLITWQGNPPKQLVRQQVLINGLKSINNLPG